MTYPAHPLSADTPAPPERPKDPPPEPYRPPRDDWDKRGNTPPLRTR